MNTVKAENETLRADLAATMSGMRTDIAGYREDAARRETRLILAMAGMIALATTILGLWLG